MNATRQALGSAVGSAGRITAGESELWRYSFEIQRATADASERRELEQTEFVQVIEGRLVVDLDDGSHHEFAAGDSVYFGRGLRGTWTVSAPFTQMIAALASRQGDGDGGEPALSFIRHGESPYSWPDIEEVHPMPADLILDGGWSGNMRMLSEAENLYAGVFATDESVKFSAEFPGDDFVWVVRGGIELEQEGGPRQAFESGEAVYIPAGWKGAVAYRAPFRQLIVVARATPVPSIEVEG